MTAPVEKVALEVAETEFTRWAESMDLLAKLDTTDMNADDKESFKQQKRPILDAIRFGRLVVDDAGQFVFTPQVGDDKSPITFFEPDGSSIMAMDKAGKSGENVHKQFAVLAAMTHQFVQRFSKMKQRDLVVCSAIMAFFLAR